MSESAGADRQAPSRWWALTALAPLAAFIASGTVSSGEYQTRLYFSGSQCRWLQAAREFDQPLPVDVCAGAIISDWVPHLGRVRLGFALDLVFATLFAVVGYRLLRLGLEHWAPARRRQYGKWAALPVTAVVAGCLDLAETSAQLLWVDASPPPWIVTHGVATIAWSKWLAYIAALVGLLGLVIGPLCAPVLRPLLRKATGTIDTQMGEIDHPTIADGSQGSPTPQPEVGGGLGLCVSGGGIRSASVMIGAFRGLDATGTFGEARWLHAVSGGGYTAGGWRVSSFHDTGSGSLFAPDHRWFQHVRTRRRYLDNGFGSMVGGVAGVVFRTVLVFGGVLAAAALVGWFAGRLTRSWALHPGFSNAETGATTLAELLAWRLVLPGLVPLTLGVVAFVATRATYSPTFRRSVGAIARVLAVTGVFLVGLLVAVPVGIRYGRPLMASPPGGGAESGASFVGILSALGVVAAVRQMLSAELKKRWSRLGGVLLLVGLFVFAGKVADDQANLERIFRGGWVPVVGVLWLLALELLPAHRLTLNGIYRKRLAATFMPGVAYSDEAPWDAYIGAGGPELVLCGTAHATDLQVGGLPALGFTFRPQGATLQDGASSAWSSFPTGSWWDGYPRAWTVSRSMALTGAAFSSAMGRQSFGSTNSLLAAVNFRLGMWVPNPLHADWFEDPTTAPRVHLGYFAKELLNRYDPRGDAFLYVTDGGHRENLGLVEQLRARPTEVIVLDASGDAPGGFATLRQATELAGIELGVEVDIDLTSVEPRGDDLPLDCVAAGRATHPDGLVTTIVYAKSQISESAPLVLRQFAATHPPYPNFSTGDQYLSEDEFDALVALGEHMARRIEACRLSTV